MSYLTLKDLAESDVDETAGRQRLEHAVGKINARTGADRFKDCRSEKQSERIHQSICHGRDHHRLMTVMNTDKLEAEAKCNDCFMNKISNENCPNL